MFCVTEAQSFFSWVDTVMELAQTQTNVYTNSTELYDCDVSVEHEEKDVRVPG